MRLATVKQFIKHFPYTLVYLIKPLQIKYYTNFKKRNHRTSLNIGRRIQSFYWQIGVTFPFNYTVPEGFNLIGFIYISHLQQ